MNAQIFEYPVFFSLLYRYGNIPVTFLLVVYLIPSVINIDNNPLYIILVIIILVLIYFINKRYLYLYQVMPYKITADEEKLICSNFFLAQRELVIYFTDISKLSGGTFSGKLKGLMLVYDGRNKINIGFFERIKDVKSLQTIILSKVNKEVYDKVVETVGLRKKN